MTREEIAREEGIEKGIEQGIETGHKKGLHDGILQDKNVILKRHLVKKFNSPDAVTSQVDNCSDPDKLDNTLDEILTAETIEEDLELLK